MRFVHVIFLVISQDGHFPGGHHFVYPDQRDLEHDLQPSPQEDLGESMGIGKCIVRCREAKVLRSTAFCLAWSASGSKTGWLFLWQFFWRVSILFPGGHPHESSNGSSRSPKVVEACVMRLRNVISSVSNSIMSGSGSLFLQHFARHLISASKGMRSILEEKSPTTRLKLDDMPLFLKAGSFACGWF